MPDLINFLEAQVRGLPRDDADVWQIGIRRLPAWCKDRKSPAGYERPSVAVCLSNVGGAEMVQPDRKGRLPKDAVAQALINTARARKALPGVLHVASEADAATVRPLVESAGVVIEIKPRLIAMDALLREMETALNHGQPNPFPPLFDIPGMTVERVRSFAQAAALYAKAKPWEWIGGEALMKIEPPIADAGMTYCAAIGELGECLGLSFHADPVLIPLMARDPEKFFQQNTATLWVIWLGEICDLPMADADLWLDHNLPSAGKAFYPLAHGTRDGKTFERPDSARLTAMEAVLRAYAAASPIDQGAGEWTRRVETFDGPREITLREVPIPDSDHEPARRPTLVIPTAIRGLMPSPAEPALFGLVGKSPRARRAAVGRRSDARERAQQLCYDAMDAPTAKERRRLCQKAVAADPDCCDALLMLADAEAHTQAQRIDRLQAAVAAGERSLGPKAFKDNKGHFWGVLETRPYMRARNALAMELREAGRLPEAADHWRAMIELNPDDNQGIRYPLMASLLQRHDDAAADKLWNQFEEDGSAWWAYGRILLCLLRKDEPAAERAWTEAADTNAFAPAYLAGDSPLPVSLPPFYTPGEDSEAIAAAVDLLPAFQAIPGAQDWLRERAAHAPPLRRSGIVVQDDAFEPRPTHQFKKRKRRSR